MKNKEQILQLEDEIAKLSISQQAIGKSLISKIYTQLFELYSLNKDLESIKRALFLQWYAISEPQSLTGIPDFEKELQRNNLHKVELALNSNKKDTELITMLKHYYEIADWYFDSLSAIGEVIKNKEVLEPRAKSNDRGVMGQYWASITG